MAMQQQANIQINLVGDGVATTFTYSFNKLFEYTNDSQFSNPNTLPTSAVLLSSPVAGSAALDGFGNLVLTFGSAWANGQTGSVTVQLNFNSGTLAGTTAAWTSATALNTTWTLPLTGSAAVTIGFIQSGTVTSGTIVFEVSQDGAAWFPIQGALPHIYTALTGWTPGVGSLPFSVDVAGYAYFRVRLSQVLAGSGTVTFIMAGNNSTNEPVPVVGQSNGTNLHMTLDDAAGGNAVNTTVKGTQAARVLGVQDLKDSGRTFLTLTAQAAAGVIADAMLSMSQNKGGTVTAAQTSYTITNGKTLRIQTITVSVRAGAAAVPFSRITLRSNTAGATVVGSAVLYQCPEVMGPAATAGVGGQVQIDFPDGLEIAGNGTISIGLSHLDQATTNILNISLAGYEY